MRQFIIKIVTGIETTLEQAEHMITSEAEAFAQRHSVTGYERVSIHRSPSALMPDSVSHIAVFSTDRPMRTSHT